MTARFPYVSQAPQAVRSAGGRRWDRAFPASTRTSRAFHSDKCDTFGLTVQVHRLRNIPRTAAIRAVFRIHSSPLMVEGIVYDVSRKLLQGALALRIPNKGSGPHVFPVGPERFQSEIWQSRQRAGRACGFCRPELAAVLGRLLPTVHQRPSERLRHRREQHSS